MLKIRNRKLYRGETCAYKGAQRERVIEEEREERRRRGGGGGLLPHEGEKKKKVLAGKTSF